MVCWRRVARAPVAGLLGLTLCGVASAQTRSPGPALPTSPVIREIEWAPRDTIVRKAKGGDNWPLTWTYHTERWDVGPGEHADFPTKWISRDGCTVYLVFSGDDCFCVRRAQIHLRQSDDNRSSD